MNLLINHTHIRPGRAYIVAEVGINHNASLEFALALCRYTKECGADAVKFQMRTPEVCVPREIWDNEYLTPWNETMSYIEYRKAMEFGDDQWAAIDLCCRGLELPWFVSVWDKPAFNRYVRLFPAPAVKIPSACITDHALLQAVYAWQADTPKGKHPSPVILSTGGSSPAQISAAVHTYPWRALAILHCTSMYPCPPDKLCLLQIKALQEKYGLPTGFSDHGVGLAQSIAAVALGAVMIERHITLDRSLPGTDQASSVEPGGLRRLIKDIRTVESAMSYKYAIFPGEYDTMKKLRRVK